MAPVPEAELERLKAEVSLQRLVEAKGVELRKHGARVWAITNSAQP